MVRHNISHDVKTITNKEIFKYLKQNYVPLTKILPISNINALMYQKNNESLLNGIRYHLNSIVTCGSNTIRRVCKNYYDVMIVDYYVEDIVEDLFKFLIRHIEMFDIQYRTPTSWPRITIKDGNDKLVTFRYKSEYFNYNHLRAEMKKLIELSKETVDKLIIDEYNNKWFDVIMNFEKHYNESTLNSLEYLYKFCHPHEQYFVEE